MKRNLLFLYFALCGLLIFQSCSNSINESFTGKIQINGYKMINGQKQEVGGKSLTLYFAPERIKIDVQKKGMGKKPGGILIRSDSSDIIVIEGSSKAIKITQSDIKSFMNLASGFMGLFGGMINDSLITFKKTGKTKTIDGYKSNQFVFNINATKFVHLKNNQKNAHLEIWMTNALNINWGFLPGLLKQLKESVNITRKGPADFVLKEGYFPVLVKQYVDSTLAKVVKINITNTSSVQSHVQLPPGIKMMDFKQFFKQAFKHLGQLPDNLDQSMDKGMANDSSSAIKT